MHAISNLSKTSTGGNLVLSNKGSSRPSNRETLELGQEASILAVEGTRGNKDVTLARTAKILLSCIGGCTIRAAVKLSLEIGNDNLLHVFEHIALEESLAGGVTLDSVAIDVGPDVVNGMEEGGGR